MSSILVGRGKIEEIHSEILNKIINLHNMMMMLILVMMMMILVMMMMIEIRIIDILVLVLIVVMIMNLMDLIMVLVMIMNLMDLIMILVMVMILVMNMVMILVMNMIMILVMIMILNGMRELMILLLEISGGNADKFMAELPIQGLAGSGAVIDMAAGGAATEFMAPGLRPAAVLVRAEPEPRRRRMEGAGEPVHQESMAGMKLLRRHVTAEV